MFEVGQKVTLEQILDAGFVIDSYNREDDIVTYISRDGALTVSFNPDVEYGVIGINR